MSAAALRAEARSITLTAAPVASSRARAHVRRVLGEWGEGELIESAELIASELVTNAVRASGELPGGEEARVRVALYRRRDIVVIEVWDGSDVAPVPLAASADDEGGRGLFIVGELAEGWGYRAVAGGGKVVWAALGARASS